MIMSSTRQFNSWAECKLAHNLPAASQVLPPRNPVDPPEANGGRLMTATIYMYMLRADVNEPFACSQPLRMLARGVLVQHRRGMTHSTGVLPNGACDACWCASYPRE